MRFNLRAGFLILLIGFVVQTFGAEQWNRFRGPNGTGISEAKHIPVSWASEDYLWQVSLPGEGHSAPIIWDDKVFITAVDEKKMEGYLLAIHIEKGTVLWQKPFPLAKFPRRHTMFSYASGTPTVDAERVYVVWLSPEKVCVVAYDHAGQKKWQRDFPGMVARHGPVSSPILADDLVIVGLEQYEPSDHDSVIMGLNRTSGQVMWSCPRKKTPAVSYSTPCLWENSAGKQDIIFTSQIHGISALNPQNGKVVWEMPSAMISRVVSSPVAAEGKILATCGQGGGGKRLIVIQPPSGENPEPKAEYLLTGRQAPYCITSLVKDGLLYTYHDQGDVSCIDFSTGNLIWSEKPGGRFYSSPVWAEGRLYCINTKGDVVVLKTGRQYELLAVNPLGEKSYATPALTEGKLILRTVSQLIAVGP